MKKVVICNKIGAFHYTIQQVQYMKELLENNTNYPDRDALLEYVNEELDYWDGKCEPDPMIDFHIEDYYKYRSHPAIVEACEKFSSDEQKIVEIDSNYYLIIEHEDGTEHVVTPGIDEFIKAF